VLKLRSRRIATTGGSYIEILRLIEFHEDDDGLSDALQGLGRLSGGPDDAMDTSEDADHEALRSDLVVELGPSDRLPHYAPYSNQPYVIYDILLHPTYNMPSLWFTLHDLPKGDSTFDISCAFRYLVPEKQKGALRSAGITGGISAAPHPITDMPAFFIHPCHTREAMENFDCSLENYMMLWLGLVGGCVGLCLPIEMAQAEEPKQAEF